MGVYVYIQNNEIDRPWLGSSVDWNMGPIHQEATNECTSKCNNKLMLPSLSLSLSLSLWKPGRKKDKLRVLLNQHMQINSMWIKKC